MQTNEPAGCARRLAAGSVDLLAPLFAGVLGIIATGAIFSPRFLECDVCQGCEPPTCAVFQALLAWGTLGPIAMAWVSNRIALVACTGTSIGLWLMGIRIEQHDGTPPGFVRSATREMVRIAGWIPLGLGSLVVWSDGRGWHDDVAGTRVVLAKPTA